MSFPKYKGYMESGIEWLGDTPTHWNTRRIRRLFEIKKRIVGTLGFNVLSITQQGLKIKDTESNEGQISMDYSKYQLVEPGDFAMNHMDLLTGYVDVSSTCGVTSPDYRVFSIRNSNQCFGRYYLYLLQNCYHSKIFYAFGQGSSQLGRWRLPADQFNGFVFPRPPLQEQQQIAAFLDHETAKIDALVDEQKELIELLKEKRQAIITDAVTKGVDPAAPVKHSGVEWLGEIPQHWVATRLSHLTSQIVDGAHLTPTYVDDGVPFLRVTDITRAEIDLDDVKRIPPDEHEELTRRCKPAVGDLLLSKNGTIGVPRVVTWSWEFSIFVSLCLIKLTSRLNPFFAKYVFLSSAIEMQVKDGSKQSTVTNLHLEKIAEFKVPVPPIEEQSAIVSFLDRETAKFDELISAAEAAITLLQERRGALISAAVTGKIDVRGLVPSTAEAA
jgi:type I restriction enzyme, S subunit